MRQVCQINKIDSTQRLVYGTFLEPDIEDLQEDIVSREDIEKAAHGFMLEYQQVGEVHKTINQDCKVVESYIDPETGAWKGVIKVFDDKVWEKVESQEYAAFSVGGEGRRIPIDGESVD